MSSVAVFLCYACDVAKGLFLGSYNLRHETSIHHLWQDFWSDDEFKLLFL